MLSVLPPEDATRLLRRRLDQLEAQLADQRRALERGAQGIFQLFLIEAEYDLAVREAKATGPLATR
ncbi:MAG: hypothetical protein JO100_12190 [Pseudonocardia sp.]|nr:hypothetical protein [Pseudonocardia sp.]